jgi:hypothetical protein
MEQNKVLPALQVSFSPLETFSIVWNANMDGQNLWTLRHHVIRQHSTESRSIIILHKLLGGRIT